METFRTNGECRKTIEFEPQYFSLVLHKWRREPNKVVVRDALISKTKENSSGYVFLRVYQ